MAIPKIIHYVWVGGKEKPKDIQRCMNTWKKHLRGYEIIEWNEKNFDINSNKFVKEAYEQKKWAYVSDYIRAYAIYNYGGIYLDTDNILVDNPDFLLEHRAFVGYENPEHPFTAAFGAEKRHPFLKDMLDFYDKMSFEFDKNDQYKNVNTKTVSDILINKYNCKKGNIPQVLDEGIYVYKDDVLCNPSKKSVAIHVFTGTWLEEKKPLMRKLNRFLRVRLTNRFMISMYLVISKIF